MFFENANRYQFAFYIISCSSDFGLKDALLWYSNWCLKIPKSLHLDMKHLTQKYQFGISLVSPKIKTLKNSREKFRWDGQTDKVLAFRSDVPRFDPTASAHIFLSSMQNKQYLRVSKN